MSHSKLSKLAKQQDATCSNLHRRLIQLEFNYNTIFSKEVSEFIRKKAVLMSSNAGYFVASMLTTAGFIASMKSRMNLGTHEMPINLFTIFVGSPTSGKSIAISSCVQNALQRLDEDFQIGDVIINKPTSSAMQRALSEMKQGILISPETAQELSAWICRHQCKANVGSVEFLKDSVLQSTGAIQELRHELAILKNKVIQSSVAEGNKNGDEFHGSEQSKLSFNVAHEPVPYDATTPQTRLPSQHLKTHDSTQHRLSYLEGKVESINEMFKFLMEEKRRNDLLFTGVIAK